MNARPPSRRTSSRAIIATIAFVCAMGASSVCCCGAWFLVSSQPPESDDAGRQASEAPEASEVPQTFEAPIARLQEVVRAGDAEKFKAMTGGELELPVLELMFENKTWTHADTDCVERAPDVDARSCVVLYDVRRGDEVRGVRAVVQLLEFPDEAPRIERANLLHATYKRGAAPEMGSWSTMGMRSTLEAMSDPEVSGKGPELLEQTFGDERSCVAFFEERVAAAPAQERPSKAAIEQACEGLVEDVNRAPLKATNIEARSVVGRPDVFIFERWVHNEPVELEWVWELESEVEEGTVRVTFGAVQRFVIDDRGISRVRWVPDTIETKLVSQL